MIAANVAAARFLDRHKVPTLYRVHGLPEVDRLETLRQFLREFGLWLPPADEVTPRAPARPAAEARRPARRAAHLDGRDPLDAAGGVPAGQHRSLRARARALRALHLADPPLPGPRRAPRHPPGAARAATRRSSSRGTGRSRCSGRTARSASAAPTRRRAARWRGSSATTCRIASARSSTASSRASWTSGCSCSSTACRSTGCCTSPRSGRTTSRRDRSGFRMIGRSSGKIFKLGDRLRVRVTNVSLDDRRVDFELAGADGNAAAAERERPRQVGGGVADGAIRSRYGTARRCAVLLVAATPAARAARAARRAARDGRAPSREIRDAGGTRRRAGRDPAADDAQLDKLAEGGRHQGVVAEIAPRAGDPETQLEEALESAGGRAAAARARRRHGPAQSRRLPAHRRMRPASRP